MKQMIDSLEMMKDSITICQKCEAKCCKPNISDIGAILKPSEVHDFVNRGWERLITWENGHPEIIMDVHGACIFLENNKCSIYNIRPIECQIFPYYSTGYVNKCELFNNSTDEFKTTEYIKWEKIFNLKEFYKGDFDINHFVKNCKEHRVPTNDLNFVWISESKGHDMIYILVITSDPNINTREILDTVMEIVNTRKHIEWTHGAFLFYFDFIPKVLVRYVVRNSPAVKLPDNPFPSTQDEFVEFVKTAPTKVTSPHFLSGAVITEDMRKKIREINLEN